MKINPRIIAIAAIFTALCAVSAFGQIRTGGYKSASVTDDAVKAAADFAVEAKSAELEREITLEEIVKAETQIVAGVNYRLCLQVNSASKDESEAEAAEFIQAVIYKNLKGDFKLTRWEASECGEK